MAAEVTLILFGGKHLKSVFEKVLKTLLPLSQERHTNSKSPKTYLSAMEFQEIIYKRVPKQNQALTRLYLKVCWLQIWRRNTLTVPYRNRDEAQGSGDTYWCIAVVSTINRQQRATLSQAASQFVFSCIQVDTVILQDGKKYTKYDFLLLFNKRLQFCVIFDTF